MNSKVDKDKIVKMPKGVNLDESVTRRELIEIMQQVTENINQISNYLMEDVNTLYSKHVFPFQIRMQVMEDIINDNGLATQEEIDKRVEKRIIALQEQAQEIKLKQEAEKEADEIIEDGDNKVDVESEDVSTSEQ